MKTVFQELEECYYSDEEELVKTDRRSSKVDYDEDDEMEDEEDDDDYEDDVDETLDDILKLAEDDDEGEDPGDQMIFIDSLEKKWIIKIWLLRIIKTCFCGRYSLTQKLPYVRLLGPDYPPRIHR